MNNTDAQLPRPLGPREEKRTKLGWVIAGSLVVLFGFIVLIATGDDESHPDAKAQDAAIVGDVVTVRHPARSILCEDRKDASKIHMIGEIAMRQSDLFDKDAGKAMMKKETARNIAMRQAYSCQWAPRGVRYTVKNKEIVGTESDEFHVVAYCLQADKSSACFWVEETFDRDAPIEKTATKS